MGICLINIILVKNIYIFTIFPYSCHLWSRGLLLFILIFIHIYSQGELTPRRKRYLVSTNISKSGYLFKGIFKWMNIIKTSEADDRPGGPTFTCTSH